MFRNRLFFMLVSTASLLSLAACAPTTRTVSSEPGAPTPSTESSDSSAPGGGGPALPPESPGGPPSDVWVSYVNDEYAFTVRYPSDYSLHPQTAEKLAQLKPTPVAAWSILSPAKASSDIANLEPIDLEIRVHTAGENSTIKNWLTSVGLLSAGSGFEYSEFHTSNISGLRLCASTMIFPGCSYFVLGTDRVYQLVPASQVGEEMVETFMWTP